MTLQIPVHQNSYRIKIRYIGPEALDRDYLFGLLLLSFYVFIHPSVWVYSWVDVVSVNILVQYVNPFLVALDVLDFLLRVHAIQLIAEEVKVCVRLCIIKELPNSG